MPWQEGKPDSPVTRERYCRWFALHVFVIAYLILAVVWTIWGISEGGWGAFQMPVVVLFYLVVSIYFWLPVLILDSWFASGILAVAWRRPSWVQRIKAGLLFSACNVTCAFVFTVISSMQEIRWADYPPELWPTISSTMSQMFAGEGLGLTGIVFLSAFVAAVVASFTTVWSLKGPMLWVPERSPPPGQAR